VNARLPATRERGVLLPERLRGELVETRDPRGATNVVGYYGGGEMAQIQEWDADQAYRLGYLANVIAYRCTQIRAQSQSSVPLVAGRKLGDAKTINDGAAITRLLGPPPGGPAPRLSARKLFRWSAAQKIITGRRAWEIESDPSGRPVAFWPLVAAELHEVPSQGGSEWFKRFDYGRPGHVVRFKPEDVFYSWDPSGRDFRQAESGLQAARYDLTLITMCDRYGISFLKNNAVPATIVTTTAFPDDDTRRAFRRQWASEFQGPANAGRVWHNEVEPGDDGDVAGSVDVKQLGVSAKDSKLIDTRKEAMVELAISLGVPWSKLDASGRTFDNADVEDRTYWEETILPDLIDLQDDINMQLAPRFGNEVVWFDLREVRVLQKKRISMSQPIGAQQLLQARIWTIDEARIDTGQEPLEDGSGDRFLTDEEVLLFLPRSASMVAPTPPATVDPAAPDTPALDPSTQPALPAGAQPNAVATDGTAEGAPVETRIVDPEVVEARRTRIWRTADAVVTGLERRWERSFQRLFARQAEAALSRLTGKRGRQATRAAEDVPNANTIFDSTFWTTAAAELAEGLYEDTATAAATRMAISFGVSFDVSAPFVQDFIKARSNQLAGQVTQTTYEAIQAAMVEGVNAGEGIDDIAARVRHVFTVADQTRAVTIARTEVVSAYNGAASLGAASLPADVVAGQEWIATRDGRTREAHADADGQTVGIGAAFSVGGHEMAYPGDPAGGASNTINCRCTVAFLTPDEFAATEGRSKPMGDYRRAKALLRMVQHNDDNFDLLGFRRALLEVAA
jgi:HK97 family phage portal protein